MGIVLLYFTQHTVDILITYIRTYRYRYLHYEVCKADTTYPYIKQYRMSIVKLHKQIAQTTALLASNLISNFKMFKISITAPLLVRYRYVVTGIQKYSHLV
jgi:hypothetical protein